MNITDIDDKIIKRARQHYLFEKYLQEDRKLSQILEDMDSVIKRLTENIQNCTDPDKKVMLDQMLSKVQLAMGEVETSVKSGNQGTILSSKDVIMAFQCCFFPCLPYKNYFLISMTFLYS